MRTQHSDSGKSIRLKPLLGFLESVFSQDPVYVVFRLALILGFVFGLLFPAEAVRAQTQVPAGSDLSALLNGGNTNLSLEGNATWNSPINRNTVWDINIEGNGHTISVTPRIYMLEDYRNNGVITIRNAVITPSGQVNSGGNYLIGLGDGNYQTTLNLEGTTFSGFFSDRYKGGGIIYPYGTGHQVTINGGTAGVTFYGNRGQNDSSGALPVFYSSLTVNGKAVFDSNWTGNYGGAMSVYEAANNVTFNGETIFTNNHSVVFGGAVDIWGGSGSRVSFNGPTTFDGNYVYHETATNTNSPPHVTDQDPRGGAMNIGYIGSGPTIVTFGNEVSFINNRVVNTVGGRTAMGGAVSVYGNGPAKNYQLYFNNKAVFDGNYAVSTNGQGDGGAIFYDSSAAYLKLSSGSEFLNNSASRYGGAIYLQAGTIELNAATDDITFQGNRQGVTLDGGYAPVAGSGNPNAIYLGSGGSMNLITSAGRVIHMYDPIASASNSNVVVTKTGGGEFILYGDNGATTDYYSLLQASTTVEGGYFTLTDGVHYGGSSGAVTARTGGILRGGNNSRLLAGTVTLEADGGLGANGGLFTVDAANINFAQGSVITGSGTLAATSNFNLGGQVTAEVAGSDQLNLTALLTGNGGLNKTGTGTLSLDRVNTYTGATNINAGVLTAGTAQALAASSAVSLAAGARLEIGAYDQRVNNFSGAGGVDLGTAELTVNNSVATIFSGTIEGDGSLVKTGAGSLTLSGPGSYEGGTTVDQGRLIVREATALGTGLVTNNSELELNPDADGTMVNQLAGTGDVFKTGTNSLTLTHADSSMGSLTFSSGRLALTAEANVNVAGQYSQTEQSTLAVDLGAVDRPAIAAGSASLDGVLQITGLILAMADKVSELDSFRRTVISSVTDIVGDFDQVAFDSGIDHPDYLILGGRLSEDLKNYTVGLGLAWLGSANDGHGNFTLANSTDSFEVDVALGDRDQSINFGSGWNGRDLTKLGRGNLILSEVNTYTGLTDILAGTLTTGTANAFARSEAVTVASGATLDLNGYDQIAQNLAGGGTISLGSARLTAENSSATIFSGQITGSGGLTKSGAGSLTLSGGNSHSGGTTVDEGRLIIQNVTALGSGLVTNQAELELALNSDGVIANQITGGGAVYKSGSGRIGLSASGSSMGSLTVSGGVLELSGDNGLTVSGAYSQNTASGLAVTVGSGPAVSAGSASLAGALEVDGLNITVPNSAQGLANQRYTVITSATDISGDFDSVSFDSSVATPDYLTLGGQIAADLKSYFVGLGLTWEAPAETAHGNFTLTEAGDSFNLDLALNDRSGSFASGWNGRDLIKDGLGNLIMAAVNGYTGLTDIRGGTLTANIDNAFAASSEVSVAAGATLDLNGFNQTARNLSGAGQINLGTGVLTVQNSVASAFTGQIDGGGSLIKQGVGDFTLSGNNGYTGGTSINAGQLIIQNGSALGSGRVTNNSFLELALTADGTVVNQLAGTGNLIKSGSSVATLNAAGSTAGAVTVGGGTLSFAQSGNFQAAALTTLGGATTDLRAGAAITLNGAFTQNSGATLNLSLGDLTPIIRADSANLAGALNIDGFGSNMARASAALIRHVIIQSAQVINSDFDSISFGSQGTDWDFLILDGRVDNGIGVGHTYSVGLELAWNATNPDQAHGTFTLPQADDNFELDLALGDVGGSAANNWNGRDLTKAGLGNLTLSAANTYTGLTEIRAGTLTAGINDAFARSSQVIVDSGATLDLNDFNQAALGLSGAGTIDLGTARLTVNNAQSASFSGLIEGTGGLTKTGAGTLTLSGDNDYSGGTAINQGLLIAQSGTALGSGLVTNNSGLELNLAGDGTVGNQLTGSGSLTKTGAGVATLTGADSSAGVITVNDGTLSFNQGDTFQAASLATAGGAITDFRPDSLINLTGAFTQNNGATLQVGLPLSDVPIITAASVDLDGDLLIEGFSSLTRASVITAGRRVIIQSGSAINGDFDSYDFGGQGSDWDFLILNGQVDDNGGARDSYSVGFGLSWNSIDPDEAHGTFTLPEASIFEVDVVLADKSPSPSTGWDGETLTKRGDGTLILSGANTYSGATNIEAGTLVAGAVDTLASTEGVTVNSGAQLSLNANQVIKNISGGGTIDLGTAGLTINNNAANAFSGLIEGAAGSLTKTGAGNLTLSGDNTYGGGTTISQGRLIAQSATALGSGAVTNNSQLELNLSAAGTVANTISGSGSLFKTGGGAATLTGTGSSVNGVTVSRGALNLAQTGAFSAASYLTESGAATIIGANSQLVVSGLFQQNAGSTLTVQGGPGGGPAISTGNADIDGNLVVEGLTLTHPDKASDLDQSTFTVIQSTNAINGNFDQVTIDQRASTVDYLVVGGWKTNNDRNYVAGLGLAWESDSALAHGTFTLAEGDSFEVDIALGDENPNPGTNWTGRDLTKEGLGELILSDVNTYTGQTNIQTGTLTTDIEDAIAASSKVIVNTGATLDIKDKNQIINHLEGGGTVDLGTAVMTADNSLSDSVFSGKIIGQGSLVKTGGSSLTLSGDNAYEGGTTISGGRLIAQSGTALGQDSVINDSELELALNADGTVANQLTGTGDLIKSGTSVATLTGANSSVGAVTVEEGALSLGQTGNFSADSYLTESGATTNIGSASKLVVTNAFTQEDGSTLAVYVGTANSPAVKAGSASIGGDLNISGLLGVDHPAKASELEDQQFRVIESDTAITGDFARVDFGSVASPADYLVAGGWKTDSDTVYVVGLGLAWEAGPSQAHGTFTLPGAYDSFEVDVVLANQLASPVNNWNGRDLTKAGLGNLILSAVNTYDGVTDIQAGTLTAGVANAFADSSEVIVADGAKLDLDGYDQVAKNLNGGGDIDLGSADLTVVSDNAIGNVFSGSINGDGRLIKDGGERLTLSGESGYTGGTIINDGRLAAQSSGALGTGQVHNSSELELNFAADGQLGNLLSGNGLLEKTGQGSVTLTADGSAAGQVNILEGDLTLGRDIGFTADDVNLSPQSSLSMLSGSLLETDTLNFDANSTFVVELGQTDPLVRADSVALAGLLNVEALEWTKASEINPGQRHVIIETDQLITTDFSAVSFGGQSSQVDYLVLDGHVDPGQLSYSVGLELAWLASQDKAHGTFTLAGAADVFEVDVTLNDRSGPFASRWTGRDLTKNGAGTLILSRANDYSGFTEVNSGLLSLTADGALGRTSLFSLASGAAAELNGTSQTIGRLDAASSSQLDFGGGLLTINENQRESGDQNDSVIAGDVLTGSGGILLAPATLTVTGANADYTGDVTVTNGSTLTLNDAAGVGLRGVINLDQANDRLVLDITSGTQEDFSKTLAGIGRTDIRNSSDINLTGNNQGYSGLFNIESGAALKASTAENLGLSQIDLAGSLNLDSSSDWAMMNTINGQGLFLKTGAGRLLIYDNMSGFTGRARIEEGALIVGDSQMPGSTLGATDVEIASSGILSGSGRVAGAVTNQGTIQALNGLAGYESSPAGNLTVGPLTNSGDLILAGASLGNTLTVTGGLISNGGRLVINTYLGGDDSPTDRLILDGGQTSGTTDLIVFNQGGPGQATNQGIMVVEAINGASTAPEAFRLSSASSRYRAGLGSLTVGAYDYSLLKGGVGGQAQSWYLVSNFQQGIPAARPEAGLYLAGREAAESMFRQSLYDRLMSYQTLVDPENGSQFLSGAWGKIEGGRTKRNSSGNYLRTTTDTQIINTGLDLGRWSSPESGTFTTGVMFGLGRAKNETESLADRRYKADGDVDGYSVGLYGYWFQKPDRRDGFYADAWVRRSWFENSVNGRGLPREDYNSRLWSASLEGGYSFMFHDGPKANWSFDPSFQVIHNSFSGGSLTESIGTHISQGDKNSWNTRLGGRLHGRVETEAGTGLAPYLEANWRHNTGENRVFMDQDSVASNQPQNTAEFKLGLSADWNGGFSTSLGLVTEFGSNDYRHVGGQLGIRYEW